MFRFNKFLPTIHYDYSKQEAKKEFKKKGGNFRRRIC